MQRSHAAILVVWIALGLVPARAAGQSVFVSGAVFANIHRAGGFNTDSPIRQDDDLSGTSVGGGFTVGASIGPHVVVQTEVMLPAALHRDFAPPTYLPPLVPPPSATFREVTYRTRHGSVLGGYRTGTRRRLSAAFLGGVMFLQERTRTVARTVPPQPFSPPLPNDTTLRYYRLAPVFGLDLDVSLFSGLSVVPQLRVYKITGTGFGAVGLWPGASLRWRF